jgi:molybdopterin synthase catalytic subunit
VTDTDDNILARLVREPIEIQHISSWLGEPNCGAVLLFCGNVREYNRGKNVARIDYHAHETMALSELRKVAHFLVHHGATRAVAIHRLGSLDVSEMSILLGIALPHRKTGFGLLEQGMEMIKSTVPIWKHEHYQDGTVEWIEGS